LCQRFWRQIYIEEKERKMLSLVQETFMEIIRYSMNVEKERNLKLNITQLEQVTELMELAKTQHMLPMVYDVITHIDCNEECKRKIQSYKMQAVLLMMSQTQRTKSFLETYDVLTKNGIKPIVVKGIVMRSMYLKPDCRCSNDEDLLINKEDFYRCHNILTGEGYQCEEVIDELKNHDIPYEVTYFNTKTKVRIEIHTELLPGNNHAFKGLNKTLENAISHAKRIQVGTGNIWTLSDTEHFLFLLSHSYKHFVYCGFGVRQLCDLLMMATKCRETIDWNYIEKVTRENRMNIFFVNLIDIGEKYLGFNMADIPLKYDIKPDSENLLDDMLEAGAFGKSSIGRIHSSNITMSAVDKRFANDKNGKMTKKKVRLSIMSSIFPSRAYMKKHFPYLKKRGYLLPLAYCQRSIAYFRERKKQSENAEEINSITVGKRRMELMRQYGII
jgi:hypothetical protein